MFKKGDKRINSGGRPLGVKNKKNPVLDFFAELLADPEAHKNLIQHVRTSEKGPDVFLKAFKEAVSAEPKRYINEEFTDTHDDTEASANTVPNEVTKFFYETSYGQSDIFNRAFAHLSNGELRGLNERGGTRSGKTRNIMEAMTKHSFFEANVFVITMFTLPRLKLGPLRDFDEILEKYNLHQFFKVNKSEHRYENLITGAVFYFKSFQKGIEARGIKSDFFYMCEADGQPYEVFKQLGLRATKGFFTCLNPSNAQCWVNQEIELKREIEKKDVKTFVSTFRDNPHLNAAQVSEIESYEHTDPEFWKVFGTGEYGSLQHMVFPSWHSVSDIEYRKMSTAHISYGVDWGFKDPMAIVEMKYDKLNNALYIKQLKKQSGLKDEAEEAAKVLQAQPNFGKHSPVFCDHQPGTIERLQDNLGDVLVLPARKESINDSIKTIRSCDLFIHEDSKGLREELVTYRYFIDDNGQVHEKVIDKDNHLMDAMRYAVHSYFVAFELGMKTKKNR